MKEKFLEHARAHRVDVSDQWSVEQIADAIIAAGVVWPDELTNQEGWQLWTATMRADLGLMSIRWEEEPTTDLLVVTFRLRDKREQEIKFPRATLSEEPFGSLCRSLEGTVRKWKAESDAELARLFEKQDLEWAARAPDLMNTLIGFRAWTLNGPKLKPIGAGNDVWAGGREVRAECGNGATHRAPNGECECGLYAWHSWKKLQHEARGMGHGRVYGAVAARGRIQLHRAGFRAEYMRPVLLGYDDTDDRIEGIVESGDLDAILKGDLPEPKLVRSDDYKRVKEIADRLGDIPVVPFGILEEAAGEFGQLADPAWVAEQFRDG